MEESLGMLQLIKEKFECEPVDLRTYSPLTLAYIGDAIYELVIRTVIVERGNRATESLHKAATKFVKAGTQAAMADVLLPLFSEEETSIYKRGRNAKSYTSAKNASIGEYRKATGLEALMGFLYLSNQTDRLLELIKTGVIKMEMSI